MSTADALFSLVPSKFHGADVTVCEANDAYRRFWRPLYSREFVPKFLVSRWLAARYDPDVYYTGGFLLSPNLWHSDLGPGEHAGVVGVHRWIAWWVPQHGRPIVEASGRQKVTCLSPRVCYHAGIPETFDDESWSDIPMVQVASSRSLHTVRDLTREDIPQLRELRTTAYRVLRDRFGAQPENIAMYFHYPVRARLGLLHVHICIGHRETGPLLARSHDLNEVLDVLEREGSYDDPRRFSEYHLSDEKDGSLRHIRAALGQVAAPIDQRVDVVVPCAPKDAELLALCVNSLRRSCPRIRRFVVVSAERLIEETKAEWFDESLFPFTKHDLGSAWRYQQILKLCGSYVIPGLLDNVLAVDADTVWHRRPLEFLRSDGVALYSTSTSSVDVRGYDEFFDRVLARLNLRRINEGESAITHHMLFQRDVLCDLFRRVLADCGRPIWEVFGERKPSEWELYYQFAFSLFPDRVARRPLRFIVTGDVSEATSPSDPDVDFSVCHSHRRLGFVDTHEDGDYGLPPSK